MTRPRQPGAWPPHLRSRRLLLRARAPDDPAPAWLPEAQTAVRGGGETCPLPAVQSQRHATYWFRPSGQPPADDVGACAARIVRHDLVWTWLAVGAAWRALGYGGAAVPIVERAAARLGCRDARVLVPLSNGIGLYFWLRLGYRPDPAAPWPKSIDGTWMRRSLNDRAPRRRPLQSPDRPTSQ